MINAEIIDYIKNQLQAGISQEKIKSDLVSNGWTTADINEALAVATPQITHPIIITSTQSTQDTSAPIVDTPTNDSLTKKTSPIATPINTTETKNTQDTGVPIVSTPIKSEAVADASVNPTKIENVAPNTITSQDLNPSPRKSAKIIIISIIILVLLAGSGIAYAYVQKIGPFKVISVAIITSDNTQEVATSTDIVNSTSPKDNSIINTNNSTSSVATTSIESSSSTIKNNTIKTPSNEIDLWAIFDKQTLALKNKDLAGYKAVSYTQVPAGQESQFIQFAPNLADMNSKINKSSYINKWQDDKQAIYSTNLQQDNQTDYYGYKKGMIMFINKNSLF